MGSGLIYALIIAMWAAYFIPMWLRRHEELSESRSVERFSRAMRILSRREPTPDQRYVVMPRRPEEPRPDHRDHRGRRDDRARRPVPRSSPSARRATRAMIRRRRVLAVLLLTTLSASILMPFTALPWWAPLALLGCIVLDLAHLRIQARRQTELSRTRQAVRRRTRSRLRRFDSAERIVEARRAIAEERAAAEGERLAAEEAAREAARVAAREEAARRAAEAAGWRPVPVPLPTYVTKPKAPTRRVVDASGPGAWSDAPTPPAPVMGEQQPFDQTLEEPDELDAIIERRRAVND